jgi:hypothetical protein
MTTESVIVTTRSGRAKRSRAFARCLRAALCAALAMTASPSLPRAEEALQEITVNAGDTMWSIANKFLKDPQRWPEIVKYNKLSTSDPTIALPGTRIRLPVTLIKEEYRKAQLIRMTPEVRYKKKVETEWKQAVPLMNLGYEDSLRTMNGAEARVLFPTREEVQINENSLVVLKPEKILQEVNLVQGNVRASRAKVIMPSGAVVKPRIASDYQAKIREDKTEVVFVYKGEVDVTAQGKTVRVPEGYGTQVKESAPPSNPVPLPEFPDFNPADITVQAPKTGFESAKSVGAPRPVQTRPAAAEAPKAPTSKSKSVVSENLMVNYKVQVSKDPKFQTIVLEQMDKIGQPFDIRKQAVPDGLYYMRLAFIDAFGVQGNWSAPTTVTRDTVPPVISDLTPTESARFTGEDNFCDVIGTVKDAAMVAINGDLVFISPTGRFTKFVSLKEGQNKITVVARDTQGNETVIERKVDYQPLTQQSR